ncbi:MAG: barstar family protein [Clostridia bacterium]
MKYEFNRNEFDWAEGFYNVLQKKFGLPDWFGKNVDALWDMLTGFVQTPCEVVFIGFNKKENDYNKNAISLILDCFIDAMRKYPEKFKVSFKN